MGIRNDGQYCFDILRLFISGGHVNFIDGRSYFIGC